MKTFWIPRSPVMMMSRCEGATGVRATAGRALCCSQLLSEDSGRTDSTSDSGSPASGSSSPLEASECGRWSMSLSLQSDISGPPMGVCMHEISYKDIESYYTGLESVDRVWLVRPLFCVRWYFHPHLDRKKEQMCFRNVVSCCITNVALEMLSEI